MVRHASRIGPRRAKALYFSARETYNTGRRKPPKAASRITGKRSGAGGRKKESMGSNRAMKKLLAVLLSLTLCLTFAFSAVAEETNDYTAGSLISMGSYEQDNDLTNGSEPVEWIVLKVEDNQAMIISRYCLDAHAYNTDKVAMTWGECTLRTWLNDTFINEIFSAEEIETIVPKTIVNNDNPHYGTEGGEDTTDRIFFLSESEVSEFFPDSDSRRAQPTAYAVAQGAYLNTKNGNTWWWLRTPGVRPVDVCGVSAYGNVTGYGSRDVNRPSGAIRPVLWVTFGD